MNLNSSPRVSILIPAKQASKTIGAALISAFVTRPRGSEIVVLLDGDDTKSKVLDYFERRKKVRLFRSTEALGITGARNFLLGKAKSEIVSWLDADDIALPFRYGKSLRSIEKKRIDLSFSHSIIFGKRLRRALFLPQFPFPISAQLSPFFLWQANPFVQSTTVARKSAIIAVGGYRDCAAEDYDLWMRLATNGYKLVRTAGYGSLYRVHDGQATSSPSREVDILNDALLKQSHLELTNKLAATDNSLIDTSFPRQVNTMLLKRSIGYRIQERLFRKTLEFGKRTFLR